MTIQQLKHDNQHIVYEDSVISKFDPRLFDIDFLKQQQLITNIAKGRGTVYFFDYNNTSLVLRHYWRGGLIGKFISDRFLYQSCRRARSIEEFYHLNRCVQLGLSVPKPVAAKVESSIFSYSADIITLALPNVRTLVQVMMTPFDKRVWSRLAKVIACFHCNGCYHDDLNANNILFSEQDIYIIDFDKARFKQRDGKWRQQNLQRLYRSLLKEQSQFPGLLFDDRSWDCFLIFYQRFFAELKKVKKNDKKPCG